MKTNLDHLPEQKQRDLQIIIQILRDEFEEVTSRGRLKPKIEEELSWLAERVEMLQALTEEVCKRKISGVQIIERG